MSITRIDIEEISGLQMKKIGIMLFPHLIEVLLIEVMMKCDESELECLA